MSSHIHDEPAAPPLNAAERHWSLIAVISCITIFGAAVSLTAPLLSLMLEARGTDTTLTGLNAGAAFLGIILGPLLTPHLVARWGLQPLMIGCLALEAMLLVLFRISDDIALWFVVRFAMGVAGSCIFTATEAWISAIAGDARRGRVIGVYASALALGFGVGPLLLSLTGTGGWAPFIVYAAITALAAVPLVCVRDMTHSIGRQPGFSPFAIFAKAPAIVLAVALFGAFEATMLSLLPIWGVRIGLDVKVSAATLSAIYLGSIALQIPIGWLSDRIERFTALRLCGAFGLLGAAFIPFLPTTGLPLFAILFVWGGLTSGLYPVALGIAGDRFRGPELVAANAALVMGYGFGSLAGPVLGGAAMDVWNPHGLFALFVPIFAFFLVATLFRRWRVAGFTG